MIRNCVHDARGSSFANYLFVGLVVGGMAMASAPFLGDGINKSVSDKTQGEALQPQPIESTAHSAAAFTVEVGSISHASSAPSTLEGSLDSYYGEAPEASGGGFPWKGVLIVGAAVVVTGVLIVTAPVSVPMAIAAGGATLIAASSAWELGECTFGDDGCADALTAPRTAFETLSYPITHPRETVTALVTLGDDLIVNPALQCSGLGSGSCGEALGQARDTGGQIVTGLRDAAGQLGTCATSGDAGSCGAAGAEIFAAFGIPAAGQLARSRIATNIATRGGNPRLAHLIAPRSARPGVDTIEADRVVSEIAESTESMMCNRSLGTCAPTAVENATRLQSAGLDARVVEYHIPGSSSSHAIAQVTMPDGSIRHLSWGDVYGGLDEVAGTTNFNVVHHMDPAEYAALDRGPYGSAVLPDVQRVANIHDGLRTSGVQAATDFDSLAANAINMDDIAGPIYRHQNQLAPGQYGVGAVDNTLIDYDAHQILGTRTVDPAVANLSPERLDALIADASRQLDALIAQGGSLDRVPAVRPVRLADDAVGGVSYNGVSVNGQVYTTVELQALRYPLDAPSPSASSVGSGQPSASQVGTASQPTADWFVTSDGQAMSTNLQQAAADLDVGVEQGHFTSRPANGNGTLYENVPNGNGGTMDIRVMEGGGQSVDRIVFTEGGSNGANRWANPDGTRITGNLGGSEMKDISHVEVPIVTRRRDRPAAAQ